MLKPFQSLLLILICIGLAHEIVAQVGFARTGIRFDSIFQKSKKQTLNFGEADHSINYSIKSPAQAKKQKMFWLERANDSIAVDVLNNPKFFSSMYPGYPPEMAHDEDLWDDYFKRVFEVDSFVPQIAKDISPTFVLVHSWLGCLDIYRRYGADYLIIGTSEVFHDAVPEVIATALTKDAKVPKVLLCAGSALQLDSAANLVEHLKAIRPELKPNVLFGYSKMNSFVESGANLINGEEKLGELDNYDLVESRAQSSMFRTFEKYHLVSFSSFVPRITWDDVYPETKDSYADRELLGQYPHMAIIPQKSRNDKRLVPMNLLDHPEELRKNVESRIKPYFHVYKKFDPKYCESPRAEADWDRVVASLKNLSSHLYIYIPPTAPLESKAVPACLNERMNRQLAALQTDAQISVLNQPWDWFGLDYADFVRVTRDSTVGIVDIQHVNFKGAEKVSARLAAWINQSAESGEKK